MKKRIIGTLLGACAVATLVACGGGSNNPTTTQKVSDDLTKNVELKLNMAYGNQQRTVTYQQSTPLVMPDGNTSIVQGQLKPMWQEIGKNLNINFKDITVQAQKSSEMITTAAATGFTDAVVYGGNNISDKLMSYGVNGNFVSISSLIQKGLMPDLERYLNENPNVKKYITAYDGNIYHIPYIAEVGQFARDFHMRQSWVEKLLDASDKANYDTGTKIDVKYNGFWTGDKARTGSNGGTVTPKTGVNITKKTNQNIITLMNNLSVKDGDSLAKCLVQYINDNYDYTKPSELYLGAKAAYDIDELIALFRVIKANPQYLTDGKATEVECYFSRQSSYREDLLRFGTYFDGVKVHGSDSYGSRWYIDNDGQIQYTYSQESLYNVLGYLSEIEAEGLIYSDLYDTANKSNFRTQLYGSDSAAAPKFGFMTYDFTASTTADSLNPDIVGVLPPVSRVNGVWQYYMDNSRVIKPDGWSISSAASDEQITRAATLFNYFFSDKGYKLQNYGLDSMLSSEVFTGPDGKTYPKYNDWTLNAAKQFTKGDLSSFLRDYVGSLMPIGYAKEIGFEYQYTSERGFAAWKLLQESTCTIPTYAGNGPAGTNKNYYTIIPPVFSFTKKQTEVIANETSLDADGFNEFMFNIIKYKTKGGAPTGTVVPMNYTDYYKVFTDAGLDVYVRTYQAAYTAMSS